MWMHGCVITFDLYKPTEVHNLAKMLRYSYLLYRLRYIVCQVGVALCIACVLAVWLDRLGLTQY